jgi:hypothetical protein
MKNMYAVEESCAPYKGAKSPNGCSTHSACPVVAKVTDFFYVGGHYGSPNEVSLMKEIRARGPVMMDFNADQRF